MRTLPGPRQRVVTSILTLGLIFHAGALALPAQESRVAPGTRVRFELRSGERYDGRVISLGRDSLEAGFPPNGVAARYPLGNISKLEVVSGRRRPVLRNALIGSAVGVVVGGVVGAASYEPCELGCWIGPNSAGESAALGAVVLGVPLLLVGGALGLIPRDRWERVPLDGNAVRFNLRTLPAGGHAVGLALAF